MTRRALFLGIIVAALGLTNLGYCLQPFTGIVKPPDHFKVAYHRITPNGQGGWDAVIEIRPRLGGDHKFCYMRFGSFTDARSFLVFVETHWSKIKWFVVRKSTKKLYYSSTTSPGTPTKPCAKYATHQALMIVDIYFRK